MLPFDVETMSWPLTSKSPPSCGVESPDKSVKPPTLLKILAIETFFNVDALLSLNNNWSLELSIPDDIAVWDEISFSLTAPSCKILWTSSLPST